MMTAAVGQNVFQIQDKSTRQDRHCCTVLSGSLGQFAHNQCNWQNVHLPLRLLVSLKQSEMLTDTALFAFQELYLFHNYLTSLFLFSLQYFHVTGWKPDEITRTMYSKVLCWVTAAGHTNAHETEYTVGSVDKLIRQLHSPELFPPFIFIIGY